MKHVVSRIVKLREHDTDSYADNESLNPINPTSGYYSFIECRRKARRRSDVQHYGRRVIIDVPYLGLH